MPPTQRINDFQKAIVIQTKALDLALTNRPWLQISQRLEQYRSGKLGPGNKAGLDPDPVSVPSTHAASSLPRPVNPTERKRPIGGTMVSLENESALVGPPKGVMNRSSFGWQFPDLNSA